MHHDLISQRLHRLHQLSPQTLQDSLVWLYRHPQHTHQFAHLLHPLLEHPQLGHLVGDILGVPHEQPQTTTQLGEILQILLNRKPNRLTLSWNQTHKSPVLLPASSQQAHRKQNAHKLITVRMEKPNCSLPLLGLLSTTLDSQTCQLLIQEELYDSLISYIDGCNEYGFVELIEFLGMVRDEGLLLQFFQKLTHDTPLNCFALLAWFELSEKVKDMKSLKFFYPTILLSLAKGDMFDHFSVMKWTKTILMEHDLRWRFAAIIAILPAFRDSKKEFMDCRLWSNDVVQEMLSDLITPEFVELESLTVSMLRTCYNEISKTKHCNISRDDFEILLKTAYHVNSLYSPEHCETVSILLSSLIHHVLKNIPGNLLHSLSCSICRLLNELDTQLLGQRHLFFSLYASIVDICCSRYDLGIATTIIAHLGSLSDTMKKEKSGTRALFPIFIPALEEFWKSAEKDDICDEELLLCVMDHSSRIGSVFACLRESCEEVLLLVSRGTSEAIQVRCEDYVAAMKLGAGLYGIHEPREIVPCRQELLKDLQSQHL